MSIDCKVMELPDIVNRINGSPKPVLVFNKLEGGPNPTLFMAKEATLFGKGSPSINIRASGPVYELVGGQFLRDPKYDWGRNFFPGGRIAIGHEEVVNSLREDYNYAGQLPQL